MRIVEKKTPRHFDPNHSRMRCARNGDPFARVGDAYRGISGTVLVERTGRFIKRKNCLVIGIFLTVAKWIFVTFLCVNSGSYK